MRTRRWRAAAVGLLIVAATVVGSPQGPIGAQTAPPQFRFPDAVTGTTSQKAVTVTNNGTGTVQAITFTSNLSVFSADPAAVAACNNLAVGASCQLVLTFGSTVDQQYSTPNPGGAYSLIGATCNPLVRACRVTPNIFSLVGTAVAPAFAVTPTASPYPNTALGSTTPATFTVTNNASGNQPIVSFVAQGGTGDFAVAPGGSCAPGTVLAPKGTCTIVVGFAPTVVGSRNSTLVVVGGGTVPPGDPFTPPTRTARLAGAGVAPPPTTTTTTTTTATTTTTTTTTTVPVTTVAPTFGLVAEPAALNFGAVDVGTPAPGQAVNIRNTGNQPNKIASVVPGGAQGTDYAVVADGCTGKTLAPNATCPVTVNFTPGDVDLRGGTLTVSGARGTSAVVSLAGAGLRATLVVAPASADLGTVPVGSVTPGFAFTVTSTGNKEVAGLAVSLDGANMGEFAVTQTSCSGTSLPPGQSCGVTVVATPADAGPRTARLVVVGAGGVTAAAGLSVTGSFTPVLVATPPVVTAGGPITVSGSGFPRNTPIRLGFVGRGMSVEVSTDANGAFTVPLMVFAHDPGGPRVVAVEDQPGRFAGVQTSVLVTRPTFRPPGFIKIGIPGLANFVSRG